VSLCGFFFQAEDGIRDFHVTGVQTCALPICVGSVVESHPLFPSIEGFVSTPVSDSSGRVSAPGSGGGDGSTSGGSALADLPDPRSEERRVGKEGRSGGCGRLGRKTDDAERAA